MFTFLRVSAHETQLMKARGASMSLLESQRIKFVATWLRYRKKMEGRNLEVAFTYVDTMLYPVLLFLALRKNGKPFVERFFSVGEGSVFRIRECLCCWILYIYIYMCVCVCVCVSQPTFPLKNTHI